MKWEIAIHRNRELSRRMSDSKKPGDKSLYIFAIFTLEVCVCV